MHTCRARRAEPLLTAAVHQHILGQIIAQMAALQQHRHRPALRQGPRAIQHLTARAHLAPPKHRRLIHVGRDHRGLRDQLGLECAHRIIAQQPAAAGGHHHRVHHQGSGRAPFSPGLRRGLNLRPAAHHAGLGSAHRKTLQQHADLITDHGRLKRHPTADLAGSFRHHAGQGRKSVTAQGADGFQVGLNAGPGRAIGTGDAEDGHRGLRHNPTLSAKQPLAKQKQRACQCPRPHATALPMNRSTALSLGMLVLANVFMTFAWYAHLRHLKHRAWWLAVLFSWGIALFEYLLQVPANRLGSQHLSLPQLKILQEVITLVVFVPFAVYYMRQPMKLDFLWAALCLCGAVYFVFRS